MARTDLKTIGIGILGLAVALLVVTVFHEIGHDEAQAWNIARASRFPWDVVSNGRVEGHTPLWHLMLWPLALSGDVFSMQLLSVGLAVAFGALLLIDRPFPLPVCILLLVGYYPFYQYGVVPRPYTVALFLVAVIGSSLFHRRGSYLSRSLLCSLLAFTSAFGVAMSIAPMFLVVTEALSDKSGAASGRTVYRRLWPGLALYGATVALATWLVVVPMGSTALESTIASGGRVGARGFLHFVESAVFPQYDRLPLAIGGWLHTEVPGRVLVALASYALVAAFAIWQWRRPTAVIAWLLAVLGTGFAGFYSGFNAERYAGHLFLAALIIAWAAPGLRADGALSRRFFRQKIPLPEEPGGSTIRRITAIALVGVLCYHATINAAVVALDMMKVQSPWHEIALDLEATVDEPFSIMATYGYDAGPLAAYLDKPVYDLRCECWIRFTEWDKARPIGTAEQIEARFCALAREKGTMVAVVTRKDWWAMDRFPLVGVYAPGYRDSEDFEIRVYRTAKDASEENVCDVSPTSGSDTRDSTL